MPILISASTVVASGSVGSRNHPGEYLAVGNVVRWQVSSFMLGDVADTKHSHSQISLTPRPDSFREDGTCYSEMLVCGWDML